MNINAVQGSAGIQKAQEVRRTEPAAPQQAEPLKKPVQAPDEYTPEDKAAHEPIGLYRVVQEDGVPKVQFDDPEKKAQGPESAPEKEPEKEVSDVTVTDTDKVDREIERLKEKQESLAQQVGREQDPQRREQLERQLAQVDRELAQKDNDTYRKQHAVVS